MTTPAKTPDFGSIMESVVIGGDLSRLTPQQRTVYYVRVCRSVGLNPYTQPFAYMNLQGKLQLYAKRDAADQLRKIHKISIRILSRELSAEGIYTVRVRATDPSGREDEDEGSVPLPETYKGEIRANVMLKAVTKAKRRATLSICGLGTLDETEVDSIAGATTEAAPTPQQLTLAEQMQDQIPELHAEPSHSAAPTPANSAAAAVKDTSPPAAAAAPLSLEDMAREAARRGRDHLVKFFNTCDSKQKAKLRKIEADLVQLYPPEE
jgi:hypothetical protein